MPTIPKSHELIEPIILQLGDRAGNIVLATCYSPLNNDLLRAKNYLSNIRQLLNICIFIRQLLSSQTGEEVLVIIDITQTADGKGLAQRFFCEVAEARSGIVNRNLPMAIDQAVATQTFLRSRTSYLRPGISPPSFPIYYKNITICQSLISYVKISYEYQYISSYLYYKGFTVTTKYSICSCLQLLLQIFQMGECVSKPGISNPQKPNFKPSPNDPRQPRSPQLGIKHNTPEQNTITFMHSALKDCKHLFQKFSNDPTTPEQINLSFMLLNTKIDHTQNVITITIINQKQLAIHVILGGTELISNTGLTIEINKTKYVQKLVKKQASGKDGDEIVIVPSKMGKQPIYIILEPASLDNGTLFLITRYLYSEADKKYKRKSQSMNWSSLAFDLEDIYGSDNLFKCDTGQQCSVCLSSPSNVILTPCRHMAICQDCSKKLQQISRKCPICRTQFKAMIGYK